MILYLYRDLTGSISSNFSPGMFPSLAPALLKLFCVPNNHPRLPIEPLENDRRIFYTRFSREWTLIQFQRHWITPGPQP